ncbi:toll/interleukin-1 receptor domain-containing protein [Aromatoleum diolicum]|uniref:TIR domain-containing protein n=1 Tax=Aromatoleum diolicum TaxID=75796 RepID=A0ABX1Q994_9RHOO|nr:toll/interleukin-1 receptor domain-containing protein [Aromatoleum diolicum]NMG74105.1 TIR domain-containing protein [Aromatoleum diolicum]
MHDLFVSHASEDKAEIARPLALALVDCGLNVWYDEFSLSLGDSLSESIDRGLSDSRFGVVILSPSFIAKPWPKRELRGLVSKEVASGRAILPVWHRVSHGQVLEFSPTLADLLAISTDTGIAHVAERIAQAIGKTGGSSPALHRSKELHRSGHYQAAVLVACAHLEHVLRARLRTAFTRSPRELRLVSSYSLGPLLDLALKARMLPLKGRLTADELRECVRIRNEAAHSVLQPSAEQTALVLRCTASVEELA